MPGIKDIFSLFYWLDNRKRPFMEVLIGKNDQGSHQSDTVGLPPLDEPHKRKEIKQFKKAKKQ